MTPISHGRGDKTFLRRKVSLQGWDSNYQFSFSKLNHIPANFEKRTYLKKHTE